MADVRAGVERGEDPDVPDKMGWTPLHFAAQSQEPEVASILIHAGATVDARDSYGKTPLAVALFNVKDGPGDVVRVLLEAGASPDAENDSGVSPRALAYRVANYDLKRFFE